MLCFLFVPAFDYKIYCLMLYHLLKSTLHLKANACSIGTFIRFYMQSSLHSKANACNIGTFIRFYIQMQVQIKNKAFAYRFYRPFTQQCTFFCCHHYILTELIMEFQALNNEISYPYGFTQTWLFINTSWLLIYLVL